MKIAFVDLDLSLRTGSRRFTYNVADELQNLGHEIGIFTTRLDKTSCFKEYQSFDVEVVSSKEQNQIEDVTPNLSPRKGGVLFDFVHDVYYYLTQAKNVVQISERIEDGNFDVTMVHHHGEHWFLPFFYHLTKKTGVVYYNQLPPLPRPEALPFQELTLRRRVANKLLDSLPAGTMRRISSQKIAMVITPSNYLLEIAKKQNLVEQKGTAVVPLGVNHSEFYPTGEEENFALYLGRIHPHKSLELAIEAMAYAEPNTSLIIAGDVDNQNLWYKEKLVQLAEKKNLSDRVKIIVSPSEPEMVQLMQKCSVFLFPSTIDTFGLVVLEAMACGKPVVACNRGGVPEIIGDAGILLEPSLKMWQKTLKQLFSDQKQRHNLGKKALDRSKHFSWEKTTKKLLEAYNSINKISQ